MRLKLYLITLSLYMGLAWLWFILIGQKFSRLQFGNLLAGNLNYVLAAVLYLLAVAGIFSFAVEPALRRGSVSSAALTGALIGLIFSSGDIFADYSTSGAGPLWLNLAQIVWSTVMVATTAGIAVWVGKKWK